MVKIENINFTEIENERFSILASIARLTTRNPLYRFLGRFRSTKNFAFHRRNCQIVESYAKEINSTALKNFAIECEKILNKK